MTNCVIPPGSYCVHNKGEKQMNTAYNHSLLSMEAPSSWVGLDLMDYEVNQEAGSTSWVKRLTCTPAGLASVIVMAVIFSPVLVVFGAFYGAFKPLMR